jgi:hypothetical protein
MARKSFTWLVVTSVIAVVFAAAAIGFIAAKTSRAEKVLKARADAIVSKKEVDSEFKARRNAETLFGPNEGRDADRSPAVEAALIRAYPSDFISDEATSAARNAWNSLNAGPHSDGAWQLIGPSKPTYPAVLNGLGDGAEYVTAGRVTAMANAPYCVPGDCPIYVGAAGGGIWRAKDGLSGHPQWEFVSGSFGTNAIGSLIVDRNDASGRTLYAGTGEPNASADSEAGVGIYKTTDGGDTWTLVPGSNIFFQRAIGQMDIDNAGNLLVPIASAVRGVGSVDGAISSGSTTHPLVLRGLWRQTATGFTLIRASAPVRGSTTVKVDPTHPGVLYVNDFANGIWRSTNNGATWTQIKTALNPARSDDRAEFDVTTLPNGSTRMYVGIGNSGAPAARFWRSDNADTAATFVDMTTAQNLNYCTGQCWYDNVLYTPRGNPDVVYLLGSFDYNNLGGTNNGRGVLLSTDGGATWSDMTQDGDKNRAEFTHPDQHAIVTNPNNPFQYWEGSDGGVIRTDGNFADVSYKCDARTFLSPTNMALCKILLSRVPNQIASLNDGFTTLQFQSLSVSTKRPKNNLQGGTQDNGTFQYTGSSVVWPQEMYGDGGQSGFNSADDGLRFNTFTGQFHDVNFRNGDPTKWVIATGAIVSSPEGSYFYPPITADPNPANGGTIFQGSFSVWRTQDWAGDRNFLEANCPEFTTSGANPACGDFVRIGPTGATDITDTLAAPVYGADRRGGAVSSFSRTTSDSKTLWASTGTGRLFISENANAAASSVTWKRLDNTATNDPNRFLNSIYVDPANPRHAWVSYSGYNVNTPAQPGHVFEVLYNGTTATWTDRSLNLDDMPITSVVRDDVTGDLYASSDFGVSRLANGASSWTVAGSGLPQVEVPGLTIVPSARLLYAATHGRSAWVLQLP